MTQSKKGGKKRAGKDMGQKDKQPQEKVFHSRKHPRVPIEMDVEYRYGESFVPGKSRNIGQGGMYIQSESPLSDGINTRIRFVLDKESDAVEVDGRVAWSNSGEERRREPLPSGMGIEFVENNENKRKLIGEFVRDLTDIMRIMAITSKKRDS